MRNTQIIKHFVTAAVILAAACGSLAQALQMGELRTGSHIGQPLDARVSLWLTTRDRNEDIRFTITPDLAYKRDVRLNDIVRRMDASLAYTAGGLPYVQLRTSGPVQEPIVAFRLKVFAGERAIMRNFSIALNPAPVAVSPRPAKTGARRTTVAPAPLSGDTYSVVSGDTLWGIARRLSRSDGTDTATLVEQIYQANPQAFVNNDQNRLRLGATLTLPRPTIAVEAPVVETPAVPADESRTVPGPEPAADIETVSATQPAARAPVAARDPVTWQKQNPELAARLEALRLKYAALKAQYDAQSTQAAPAAEPESGPADTSPALETEMVATSPSASDVTAASDVTPASDVAPAMDVAETAAVATPGDSATAPVTGSDVTTTAPVATIEPVTTEESLTPATRGTALSFAFLAIIAALFVLVVLFILSRRLMARLRARSAHIAHREREEDFKAEVARKAASRIQMEGEVKRMLERRSSDSDVGKTAAPAAASAPVDDDDAKIDMNIAHGRYDEAESLLQRVIRESPRNHAAKLRLLEVYYMTERAEAFCALADDIQGSHRADLTDDEWRRVIRMGKIIAPTAPLFSGPRAVRGSDNAAS